jgi:hypothetical protein
VAYPTAVNDQITDAVSQTNVKVVGESPAIGLASQMLSVCHAHSIMAYNAVSHQQQSNMVSLSSIADSISQMNTEQSQMFGDMATKMAKSDQLILESNKSILDKLADLKALESNKSVLDKIVELQALLQAKKPY